MKLVLHHANLRPAESLRRLLESALAALLPFARIEEALAGKPVRLARIETTTLRGALPDAAPALSLDELNALKPEAFFLRLYQQRFGSDAPPELMAAFGELLDAPFEEGAA